MPSQTTQKPGRRKVHDYIVYFFIIISIFCIAYPIKVYLNKWGMELSPRQNDWDMFSNFMGGTIGPIIGTLCLLVTTYIVYEFNLYQKNKHDQADTNQLQQTTINLLRNSGVHKWPRRGRRHGK